VATTFVDIHFVNFISILLLFFLWFRQRNTIYLLTLEREILVFWEPDWHEAYRRHAVGEKEVNSSHRYQFGVRLNMEVQEFYVSNKAQGRITVSRSKYRTNDETGNTSFIVHGPKEHQSFHHYDSSP